MSFEPQVTMADIGKVFYRRRRVLGASVLFFLLLTVAYMLAMQPSYTAQAVLQVESEKSGLLLEQMRDRDPERYQSILEGEMAILWSRHILSPVIESLGLDLKVEGRHPSLQLSMEGYESAEFQAEKEPAFRLKFAQDNRYVLSSAGGKELAKGRLGEAFRGPGLQFKLNAVGHRDGQEVKFTKLSGETALKNLRERMHVEEVAEKSNLIRISVTLSDPTLAMSTANAITDSYVARHLAYRGREIDQTVSFLEGQLQVVQGKLESSEKALGNLKSHRGIIVLSEEAGRLVEQMSRMEMSKAELMLRHRQLTHIVGSLAKAGDRHEPYLLGEASLSDEMTNRLVADLSAQLVKLRGMSQMYTDKTAQVRMLQEEVDELKAKIRAAVENGRATTAAQLASADKMLATYEARLRQLPQAERELAALTRRSQVDAEIYTFLLKKYEEARLTQAAVVGNIRVVDRAVRPEEPSSPGAKKLLTLGVMMGLLVGSGLVFALEYSDDTVKSSAEVERELGLPVIGEIPELADPGSEGENLRIDMMDARSAFVEAFRSLRAGMLLAPDGSLMRVILCTSTSPGDGKSTVASNLAIAMSRDGKSRVLLIDGDLRRSGLHAVFGLEPGPGLCEVLRGTAKANEVIVPTEVSGLYLLRSGKLPDNPLNLLDSARLGELFFHLRSSYDAVIIDASPAGLFADSALLGTQCDGAFFVAAMGHTRLPKARECVKRLRERGIGIQGSILTRIADIADDTYVRYYNRNATPPTFIERVRKYLINPQG